MMAWADRAVPRREVPYAHLGLKCSGWTPVVSAKRLTRSELNDHFSFFFRRSGKSLNYISPGSGPLRQTIWTPFLTLLRI